MDSGSCGEMMTSCKCAISIRKSVSVKCRLQTTGRRPQVADHRSQTSSKMQTDGINL